MATARPVLLAAGGTGGHLFPAEALAVALARHGVSVHLATDERASRYGGRFPADMIHEIPSATVSGGSPVAKAVAVARLAAPAGICFPPRRWRSLWRGMA